MEVTSSCAVARRAPWYNGHHAAAVVANRSTSSVSLTHLMVLREEKTPNIAKTTHYVVASRRANAYSSNYMSSNSSVWCLHIIYEMRKCRKSWHGKQASRLKAASLKNFRLNYERWNKLSEYHKCWTNTETNDLPTKNLQSQSPSQQPCTCSQCDERQFTQNRSLLAKRARSSQVRKQLSDFVDSSRTFTKDKSSTSLRTSKIAKSESLMMQNTRTSYFGILDW